MEEMHRDLKQDRVNLSEKTRQMELNLLKVTGRVILKI